MPIMIFTMLVVLVLAAAVIAVVVMGMEGTGRQQHPEIADAMAKTALHLNGEGEPPRALVTLFDEIDEVPDINVRELPARIRSLRSATSARSAATAASAPSASSPASPGGEDTPALTDGEGAPALTESDGVPALLEAAPEHDRRDVIAAALATPADEVLEEDPYGVSRRP